MVGRNTVFDREITEQRRRWLIGSAHCNTPKSACANLHHSKQKARNISRRFQHPANALPKPEHRYELIVYWNDADAAFVVEVPELPGCMADGSTYAESVAAAEVVIAEWIATARELGRAIPEPRGRLLFA